jgi:crotonobetaine/carnitine-CoA ligase
MYTPLLAPRMGSCGKPAAAFSVRLVDPQGFEVPVGEPGELLIRPEQPALLMQGYYGMPEATLAAFKDLWFHTGDVLRQDADGYMYFVGRRKDMVRRRGENIACAEVEMGIETHPDVLECAVFGVPSDMTEEDIMACVVLRPGAALAPAELAEHCAGQMARFMVPRYLRFAAELPRTPTDKVEKFRLQAEGITPDTWDREACSTG